MELEGGEGRARPTRPDPREVLDLHHVVVVVVVVVVVLVVVVVVVVVVVSELERFHETIEHKYVRRPVRHGSRVVHTSFLC